MYELKILNEAKDYKILNTENRSEEYITELPSHEFPKELIKTIQKSPENENNF